MTHQEVENLWNVMSESLDEKQRRIYAGALANQLGYGGLTLVHNVTGLALNTIIAGKIDIEKNNISNSRIRAIGGGRKLVEENNPEIVDNIIK